MSNHYEERDAYELDKAGGYYTRYVVAMTKEGLHSKSDIAAELAHRDYEIDKLKVQVEQLRDNASEIVDDYFDYIERYQIDSEDMNSSQKRKYDMMVALNSSIVATPAQCLAEIKAQGIMDALSYAKEKCSTYLDVDFYVMEYANMLTDAAKGE